MAKCLSVLPNLECLNIAATPITSIPPCSSAGFQTLARMSLADTRITTWRDIDHLADWTSGKLQNLRISCADKRGESDDGPEPILHPPLNATAMTGDPRTDRPFLIAKLSTLTFLNGTTVSTALIVFLTNRYHQRNAGMRNCTTSTLSTISACRTLVNCGADITIWLSCTAQRRRMHQSKPLSNRNS